MVIPRSSELLALKCLHYSIDICHLGFVTYLSCCLAPSSITESDSAISLTKFDIIIVLGLIAGPLATEEKHMQTFSVTVQNTFSGFAV